MTGAGATFSATLWVDAEVHLFPPQWCASTYQPPAGEAAMRRAFFDHPEREQALSKATVDGLLAEMETAGIDRAVITALPWMDPDLCWQNNAYIAEVVQDYPDRFTGLGVLPTSNHADLPESVSRLANEYGLRGVKTIPTWQGFRLNDETFIPAIEKMIEHNLVLMPHTDHLFVTEPADTATALFSVAKKHPELRILAPHLGGLLCMYGLYPPVKEVLDNILFITTVPLTMQMIKYAVDAIGAEHLAFGTDFPFNPSHDQQTVKKAFIDLGLSAEQQAAIAGANALRFLEVAP